MMARNPAERPQTPAEVADALTVLMQAGLFATAPLGPAPSGLSLGGSGTHMNPLPPPPARPAGPPAASTRGHEGGIHAIAVTPDGAALLTGGLDGTIKLWNPSRLKELRTLANDLGSVEQLVVAADGKWVAACCVKLNVQDMGVQLFEFATGRERQKLRGPADNIRCGAV